MSAALRQSELTIRTCILYEVLNENPVQESFDNFCRKVGNDVMPYYDFQFWFYRFYNENHDLHYDRSADPVPPLLSNMPSNVIDDILNHMDIIDLLPLMKVLRNFRRVIQNMNMVIDRIDVWEFENHLMITYKSQHKVEYRPNDRVISGPFRAYWSDRRKEFTLFDENYIEMCVKDLKLLMENQNVQLKEFQFVIQAKEERQIKFIHCAKKAFKNAKSSTRTVWALNISLGELGQLLPIFHAGKLEHIVFSGHKTVGYEQLVGLEQWKNARNFNGFKVCNVPIEHFFHFEAFNFHFARFTEEDAMKIRNMLDRSTSFGRAEIIIDSRNISVIKRAFDVHNDKKTNFVYQTPDNGSFDIACFPHVTYITKLGYKFEYNNNSDSTFPATPVPIFNNYQFND